jgi:ubiquinone/menaquinone biosynthesis C-methylase UbiE
MSGNLAVANLDPSQPMRVLEIGCSSSRLKWARYCGGLLFENASLEYVGIDPVVETLGSQSRKSNEDVEVLPADCQDMPFEDRTFDVVMMRSLFGQCTDNDMLHHLYGLTRMGLMETYRVLKPGGEVVVTEENTPWDAHDIEALLTGRGFRVDEFEYMSELHWTNVNPNSPWLQLRRKYYGDDPTQQSKWVGQGDSPPYIMVGTKPEDAQEIAEKVHLGFDPATGEDLFTARPYIRGEPVNTAPLTQNKFTATYA